MTNRKNQQPSTFSQVNYSDGTPSREIEEDWETTGQEEMNRLHAECKHKRSLIHGENNEKYADNTRKSRILHIRDRLCNLKDLLTVCHESLSNSQLNDIKTHVGNVIYFQVIEQIKLADEELSELWVN